jgi:hypothetical protein
MQGHNVPMPPLAGTLDVHRPSPGHAGALGSSGRRTGRKSAPASQETRSPPSVSRPSTRPADSGGADRRDASVEEAAASVRPCAVSTCKPWPVKAGMAASTHQQSLCPDTGATYARGNNEGASLRHDSWMQEASCTSAQHSNRCIGATADHEMPCRPQDTCGTSHSETIDPVT